VLRFLVLALASAPALPHGAGVAALLPGLSPLAKVLVPLGVLAVVGLVCRARRISLPQDLGLVRPPLGPALAWLGLALVWMLGTDAALHWRGAWDFRPWQAQPLWVSAARVLGVGLLGPLAEEAVFRGLLDFRLRRAGLPAGVVLGLVAAGWAALHYAYAPAVVAVIFGEGLLLGLARQRTGSLWVPVLMHVAWNLYAVW
jgi:membrane protease YdiL (CAAX protease family)